MQEGKALYRRFWRRLRPVCSIAAIVLCSIVVLGFDHLDCWNSGMGGVLMPGGLHPCGTWMREDGYAAIIASRSSPYSIEGLSASTLELDYHGRAKRYSLSWGVLDHDLYHEDRLEAKTGFAFPGRSLMIGCRARATRKKAESAAAEHEGEAAACAGIFCKGIPALQIDCTVYRTSARAEVDVLLMAMVEAGNIRLVINRVKGVDGKNANRFGACIAAGGGVSVLLGYRPGPEIMSAGLQLSRMKTDVCVSWESHPVLGNTFSAGVGRIWRR